MNQYSLGLWDQRFWDCLQRCTMIEWWERGILRHEKSPLLEELAWWWEWSCQKLLLCQQPASPCQPYCSSRPHTRDHCLPSLSLLAKKVSKLTHSVFTIPTNVTRKLTRSGCPTFCCTNCLCSCPHLTWDGGSPRDHNLSRSWWTSHKYPIFLWIFSTKKVIGPATASYDLFMKTWAVFQVPYNTARRILFLLIFTYHLEF